MVTRVGKMPQVARLVMLMLHDTSRTVAAPLFSLQLYDVAGHACTGCYLLDACGLFRLSI